MARKRKRPGPTSEPHLDISRRGHKRRRSLTAERSPLSDPEVKLETTKQEPASFHSENVRRRLSRRQRKRRAQRAKRQTGFFDRQSNSNGRPNHGTTSNPQTTSSVAHRSRNSVDEAMVKRLSTTQLMPAARKCQVEAVVGDSQPASSLDDSDQSACGASERRQNGADDNSLLPPEPPTESTQEGASEYPKPAGTTARAWFPERRKWKGPTRKRDWRTVLSKLYHNVPSPNVTKHALTSNKPLSVPSGPLPGDLALNLKRLHVAASTEDESDNSDDQSDRENGIVEAIGAPLSGSVVNARAIPSLSPDQSFFKPSNPSPTHGTTELPLRFSQDDCVSNEDDYWNAASKAGPLSEKTRLLSSLSNVRDSRKMHRSVGDISVDVLQDSSHHPRNMLSTQELYQAIDEVTTALMNSTPPPPIDEQSRGSTLKGKITQLEPNGSAERDFKGDENRNDRRPAIGDIDKQTVGCVQKTPSKRNMSGITSGFFSTSRRRRGRERTDDESTIDGGPGVSQDAQANGETGTISGDDPTIDAPPHTPDNAIEPDSLPEKSDSKKGREKRIHMTEHDHVVVKVKQEPAEYPSIKGNVTSHRSKEIGPRDEKSADGLAFLSPNLRGKRVKSKSSGKSSPYFTPPRPKLDPSLVDRVDFYNSPSAARKAGAGKSTAPAPSIHSDKFGLIQERLWQEPFWLIIAVTFLNKTAGRAAAPVFWQLKQKYSKPESLAHADEDELRGTIHHLGLQSQRSKRIIKIAAMWIESPPRQGRRFRTLHYPYRNDGKHYGKKDVIEEDAEDVAGALEIGRIPGCGAYAYDSWRIFCRDVLRGLAGDYNGTGAVSKDFEPEWKRVLPADKELRACLRWMWLREGWIWDPATGQKQRATNEEMDKAVEGEMEINDPLEREFAAQGREWQV